MESGLLLDVVVRQSAAILQLLASKDKTLPAWGNAFFILNLGLHIFNSVWGLHFQSDDFTSQGLHRDLHATSQTQNQMEGGPYLDVVVRQCDQRFPSPGLPWREQDASPVAWVMLVGNSSGVTKKTAPNVPDAPTMPSIADTTDSVLRAWIYALLLVVLFFMYLSAEVFGEASRAVKQKIQYAVCVVVKYTTVQHAVTSSLARQTGLRGYHYTTQIKRLMQEGWKWHLSEKLRHVGWRRSSNHQYYVIRKECSSSDLIICPSSDVINYKTKAILRGIPKVSH